MGHYILSPWGQNLVLGKFCFSMDKTQVYIHTVHKQTYGISSMEEMLKKKMSKAIGGDSKKKDWEIL